MGWYRLRVLAMNNGCSVPEDLSKAVTANGCLSFQLKIVSLLQVVARQVFEIKQLIKYWVE